jgi:hypothetical protein
MPAGNFFLMNTLVTLDVSMRLDIFASILGIGIYYICNVLVCKVVLLLTLLPPTFLLTI